MPDLDLAIEHLRMTVVTAHAVEATQSVVVISELAAVLAELDRLHAAAPPEADAWAPARTEWSHGSRDPQGGVIIWPRSSETAARREVARLCMNPRDGVRYAVLRTEVGPTLEADELGTPDA